MHQILTSGFQVIDKFPIPKTKIAPYMSKIAKSCTLPQVVVHIRIKLRQFLISFQFFCRRTERHTDTMTDAS